MTRIESVAAALFPVEVIPAGAIIHSESGDRFVRSATAKAVVDTQSNRIVGVVGDGYRLVTNSEAVEWARACGQAVFPRTTAADWVPQSADGPASGSYCRIDVMHRATALELAGHSWGMGSAFGPFIRVTNSYNGQRALRFDIGILRWACSNGMIVVDTKIEIRFQHSRSTLPGPPKFTVDNAGLSGWLDKFDKNMASLSQCAISHDEIRKLVRSVLGIRPPKSGESSRFLWQEWAAIEIHIKKLVGRYVDEVGENAYAAFNVMTDFATRPVGRGSYHRERHILQSRVGHWFPNFAAHCGSRDFDLVGYLQEIQDSTNGQAQGGPGGRLRPLT